MDLSSRKEILLQLGVPEIRIEVLENYLSLLWQKNTELNLISRKMTPSELVDNHLIDCLLALPHFPKEKIKTVADFGSGGGFPGVVYALLFPDIQFILFEKSPKKQEFLKACQTLSSNIQVRGDIPDSLVNVDLVTARAFKPLDVIFQISSNYAKGGGKYFLLKGRLEKINEELAHTPKHLIPPTLHIIPLASPVLEVERHLVFVD